MINIMLLLNRWQAWARPWKSSSLVTLIRTEGQNSPVLTKICHDTNLTWPFQEMKLCPFSMPLARSLPALFSLKSSEKCCGKDEGYTTRICDIFRIASGLTCTLSVIHSMSKICGTKQSSLLMLSSATWWYFNTTMWLWLKHTWFSTTWPIDH